MHRTVLGPRPRPTSGHEPDPFKQARNGPLTGTKRPELNPTVTTRLPIPRPRATNPFLCPRPTRGPFRLSFMSCTLAQPKTLKHAQPPGPRLPAPDLLFVVPSAAATVQRLQRAPRRSPPRCHCHLTPPVATTVQASSAAARGHGPGVQRHCHLTLPAAATVPSAPGI
jgi:hypothetical protein